MTYQCPICNAAIPDGMVRTCSPLNCPVAVKLKLPGIDATEALLKSRDGKYGDVGMQASVFTGIMDAMGRTGRVAGSLNPVQRQSVYMIALKLSRIVCGNPNEPDHWRDIAGYARLPIRDLPDTEGGA